MRKDLTRKQEIYNCIVAFGRPVCKYEIDERVNRPINWGRITDLCDDNFIVAVGRFRNPGGRLVTYWEPTEGSKMKDGLVKYEKTTPPEIPADWDFAKADAEFDENIKKWRRLLFGAEEQMWFFYCKLARPGKRTDLGANAPGWQDWLESKGICKDTPLRHFKARGWLPDDKPKQIPQGGRYFIED